MKRFAKIDRRVGLLLAVLGLVLLAGCATDEGDDALADVTEATASYEDLGNAEQDGYVQFSAHVPGMGIHYLDEGAFGEDAQSTLDRSLDRADPEILVYVEDEETSELELVAVEYAVPVEDGETDPPQEALDLFEEADAEDWHAHPSRHELGLDAGWTVHAECHYEEGAAVFLAEDPEGEHVQLTPEGPAGTWNGTIAPDQCPEEIDGEELPPLMLAHGKWWTLHAWVGLDNPRGLFHPTNPNVSP